MYSAEIKEIPTERAIFSASWELLRAFYKVDGNAGTEVWDEIVKQANDIYDIGQDTHAAGLAEALATATVLYLQYLCKGRRQGA